jgi:hypothetical protein
VFALKKRKSHNSVFEDSKSVIKNLEGESKYDMFDIRTFVNATIYFQFSN